MKVRAFAMDGHLARTAQNSKQPEDLEYYHDILCEGTVTVTKAYIEQGTQKEHHRPYLVLNGIVTGIAGNFPQNVTEVRFDDPHNHVQVSYQYQFTNEELASMCQKGLFDDGFTVPEIFTKNKGFLLPMQCDCFTVKNTEVPLLFVSVQSPFNLEIDSKSCGYVLGDYFEQAVVRENEFVDEDVASVQFSDEESLFTSKKPEAEKEAPVEEPKRELSEEEQILSEAFTNIETRVDKKVLEWKSPDSSKEDEPDAESESEEPVSAEEPEPSEDDMVSGEDEEWVAEDFPIEDDEEKAEDIVSESEEESEDEKKKSNAMQTAVQDIKEAVAEEKQREVPSDLSDIADESDQLDGPDEDQYV